MASNKLLFLFFFIPFLYSATTDAVDPIYLNHECVTSKNFTKNSAYQNDLNDLFSFLSSNATGKTEFYNTTVTDNGNPSDTVYGLFMCTGYVTSQLCHQCVRDANARLSSDYCDYSKEAIIWYHECLVRYSNRSFFSTVDTRPRYALLNTANVSDQSTFSRILFRTMNATADEAAKPALGKKKYATKHGNVSKSESVYCLVECTPDLSPKDCRSCLSDIIGDLQWYWMGKQGGRVLYPSCNIRYELYAFYDSNAGVASPAPPSNSSDSQGKGKGQSQRTIMIIVVSIVVVGILIFFGCCILRSEMRKRYKDALRENYFGSESATLESLQFSLATIEAATNKFSNENRIGKGGFGEVYKGILPDGREIAVKRLSQNSGQGAMEFKNEILLIAKLQHRNLVALLGFCLEGQEKVLVYEFVPNNSLDYFLFGSQKRKVLTWPERYNIIRGVAQGILYLHDHSRLKVIHRDLKPSNILLDNNMIPKISDFGLAKMVGIEETEGSTNRIVGTFGYMSPEYAMLGHFSEKSDIFSFGVMILEIVSGKKNTSCHESHYYVDGLLSYAWKQWRDEKLLEILDSNMIELGSDNEVMKCIQIGLLCVQGNPNVRPSMVTVVQYLENDSIELPSPQQPAFFMHNDTEPSIGAMVIGFNDDASTSKSCSVNDMSLSAFFPR